MALSCATAEDVLKTIKDEKVQMIDLRFTDLPGVWQHFSVPPSAIDTDALEEGIGFDGSSIRGFQEIQESDMLVVPDPTTAFLDPFSTATTLVLICNIRDPVTGQTYSRDARYVAQKAEAYLKSAGVGDAAYFGPEAEFFVFNEVRYGQGINYAMHEIDSKEGTWNTGTKEAPNLGAADAEVVRGRERRRRARPPWQRSRRVGGRNDTNVAGPHLHLAEFGFFEWKAIKRQKATSQPEASWGRLHRLTRATTALTNVGAGS